MFSYFGINRGLGPLAIYLWFLKSFPSVVVISWWFWYLLISDVFFFHKWDSASPLSPRSSRSSIHYGNQMNEIKRFLISFLPHFGITLLYPLTALDFALSLGRSPLAKQYLWKPVAAKGWRPDLGIIFPENLLLQSRFTCHDMGRGSPQRGSQPDYLKPANQFVLILGRAQYLFWQNKLEKCYVSGPWYILCASSSRSFVLVSSAHAMVLLRTLPDIITLWESNPKSPSWPSTQIRGFPPCLSPPVFHASFSVLDASHGGLVFLAFKRNKLVLVLEFVIFGFSAWSDVLPPDLSMAASFLKSSSYLKSHFLERDVVLAKSLLVSLKKLLWSSILMVLNPDHTSSAMLGRDYPLPRVSDSGESGMRDKN